MRSEVVLGDLVRDVHCIIEAMIPRGGGVDLQQPQLLDVPEVRAARCRRVPRTMHGSFLLLRAVGATLRRLSPASHAVMHRCCCCCCVCRCCITTARNTATHPPHQMHTQLVFCDPDRLRGVLLNLYTNAAKFTKGGHIVLRVRCCSSDATPPVPPGYSAIMLQPSYQPSSCSNRCVRGSGALHSTRASSDVAVGASACCQCAQARVPPCNQPCVTRWLAGCCHCCCCCFCCCRSMDIVSHIVMDHHSGSSSVPATPHCSMDGAAKGAAAQQHPGAADAASCKGDDASTSSSAVKGGPYDLHARSAASAQQQQPQQQGTPADAAAAPAGDAGAAAAAPPVVPGGAAGAAGPARGSGSIGDTPCWLLFEVEDTGVGITRDGLASLFREYVQGTEAEMCKPRTRGGTGLGLSICSKQVGGAAVTAPAGSGAAA